MTQSAAIAWAKHYVALSNAHELAKIKSLFIPEATYCSAYFGEYRGRDAIHAMMQNFFSRFPDTHWEVPEYGNIGNDGVEFAFIMTGMDTASGEQVQRIGLERIYFTPDGLIGRIEVCKPDGADR